MDESREIQRADTNKSPLTRAITVAAVLYLAKRGFKPIETEVPVLPGWVSDIAGVCVPTWTEAQKLKLLPKKDPERELVYQALPTPLTAIVEVKLTRTDFLKDRVRKFQRLPAHLCYLSVPRGLLTPDEWPTGWFVLEHNSKDGRINRLARHCEPSHVEPQQSLWLLYEIALRRHNRTHRRFVADMGRQRTVQAGTRRIDAALRAVTHWLNDRYESLQEAFAMGAVRTTIPKRTINELAAAKAALQRSVSSVNPDVRRDPTLHEIRDTLHA